MLVVTVANDVVEDSEEVDLLVVIGVAVVSEDAVGSIEFKMIVVCVLVANSAVVISVLGTAVSKGSSVNVSGLVASSAVDEIELSDLINDLQ
jgi:hypothetical protein